ncbi:DUF726-domain-containing protein [Xylariomycetidae sp. FL0641]|nr:DUF726-domain-containing protein [Xylariomycetidae sp. FL0641]
MAPLTNEPDAIRVVLNPARRKAYYNLVTEICAHMRSQLALPPRTQRRESSPPPPPYVEAVAAPVYAPSSHQQQQQQQQQQPAPRAQAEPLPSPALVRLQVAALQHFDGWRAATLPKLKAVVAPPDDAAVAEARRARAEALRARDREVPAAGEDLLSFFGDEAGGSGTAATPTDDDDDGGLAAFRRLYRPLPTRLATVPPADRREVLSATLLLLLSLGHYAAHSRTLLCYLASALGVPPAFLDREETEIATTMVEAAQKADADQKEGMSAEAEAQKRREEGQVGRYWKVGLASVAGAALIGVTGGIAAPAVAGVIGGLMGSVGLGGLASFLGIFWMNGALVGTLFGAFGAKMTGEMMDQYAKEVDDFRFLPLKAEWGEGWSRDGPESRRLRVTIGINGWLEKEEDVTKPWRVLGDESEVFALRYEMKSLMSLGTRLKALVSSAAWTAVKTEILTRTVLATLKGALWPIFLLNSASNIDNPFSLARNRSEKAGKILADALINRVQGERPVTLVGYSLGARVIYSCLRVLAERKAFGLVDTVVLIGAPVPSNSNHWQLMRTVVSGKLFNVYSENDFILAFLYRSTSLQLGIAGLQAISSDVEGIENLDLTAEVSGHLRYPDLIPQILNRCGFLHIKGGERAIEKEKTEEIQMQDRGFGQLGSLIDFGEPDEKPQQPPRQGVSRETGSTSFGQSFNGLEGIGSSGNTIMDEWMKDTAAVKTSSIRLTQPAAAASMPSLQDHSPSLPSGFAGNERSKSTSQVYEQPTQRDVLDPGSYDEDADEFGGGIQMMDNDSSDGERELTIIEPLSIDDE